MTIARLISPALRSGLLMAAGTALIGVPFALGLGAAAIVTGVAIGVIIVALALAGTAPSGRGTLPVSAQAVYDRGIGFGLLCWSPSCSGSPATPARRSCSRSRAWAP